ncbi:hypothetical protein [Armatimonas rosea]|uniref:Uncharacterized protein n=1 Tax=Armatimonas rosea TaxID=685828 RepID=A0A7W9W8D8_ARMRO|nr:hypothetical protein [Armatimonas rosea]MBB6052668.1 hypothetical protein [Armatimonas rosea]
MSKISSGDTVTVAKREQTPADIKSGLYYPHYGGLSGTILKVYGDEASILVDRDTMTTELRKRHEENEKSMKAKWLDGLSEEARNRLTGAEKKFALNYAILVAVADLAPGEAKRITPEELAAKEEAFLASRK